MHEPRDRMGVSHLLEHMVFKGTGRRSAREIALALETLGGSLDAYTSREHTVYQARVLDEHLGIAVDVLGDMVFDPALRESDLALERNVVIEEIGMVEDTPDDLVFELHNEAMWGGHPLGYSILGTRDSVSALTIAHLRDLHTRAYHPGNIVVAAAGHVEHEELIEQLARAGWAERAGRSGEPFTLPPGQPLEPVRRHVPREGTQTHIVLGSPAIGHGDPRRHAMVLLSLVLGGGMSSRLFQRVREEMGLAYAVYTFQSFYAGQGIHGVYVATAPGTAQAAQDAISEELARVVRDGLTDEEMAQGKSQLKGQLTLSLESPAARMYRAAGVVLNGEPYRTLDEMLALVDDISAEGVHDVARAFFDPERQTVLTLGPAKPAAKRAARKRAPRSA